MITDEEIRLLLNDIRDIYGYDFTGYSYASLRRRVGRLTMLDRFQDFEELRHRVHFDASYFKRFVEEITVNVTEMFRDPSFYRVLKTDIIPVLGTKPFIRIWHAGCSTGEEVFSIAIILHEAGLLKKSLIYATDINPGVLDKARSGVFPISQMKQYSQNYILSGGQKDFSSYYTANYGQAKLQSELSEKLIFSTHNLVSDGSFNEFDLVLCRNVLIYFDKELQERVFKLFDDSLGKLGYLALGTKETLKFSGIQKKYTQVDKEKIWRKIS
jgi:chemotaxis protein methyltransferase CheR